SLLKHDYIIRSLISLIDRYWSKANTENAFGLNWELMKFEIGKYLRKCGKEISRKKKQTEDFIISNLMTLSLTSVDQMSDQERNYFSQLQNSLDEMYQMRAKGAFIRSRQRWLEEGEQNSAYFFNLEKSRYNSNTIHKLKINENVCNDPREITSFCADFYRLLYSSTYNSEYAAQFFDALPNLKKIDESNKLFCDQTFSLPEILGAIKHLKMNKSPGVDGLSSEFYKLFSKQLAPFLLQVYLESFVRGTLPATLTQGLTTLIPKPKKYILLLDNWRPICLLNNDYKILALVLAKRLKNALQDIIDESQSGFMKGRHISNNIRLILDIIDLIEDVFIKAIQTLYANGNSAIKLKSGTSPRFQLHRGIRQGCPVSPYLFLLAGQLLSTHLRASPIQGINIANRSLLISQLADDTTLFLCDSEQVPLALDSIQIFSRASGLYLNINKCELFAIKDCTLSSISNIPIKQNVVYLGITITKNDKNRCVENLSQAITRTRTKLNLWLHRDLTLRGRTLLSKAEGLSSLVYLASPLFVDNNTCKEIDQLLLNFLWKHKIHYIKKSVIMNPIDMGGLDFLTFSTLNNTLKVKWIKQYLSCPSSCWNFIPNYLFSQLIG
uniref:Reverse transcriptase domain-containing protein n=1 Tax=Poecilia formosa TaxID=48698 RepID=A0A096MC09_POEFO